MYISKINIQIIMIVCTFLIHQYQKLLDLWSYLIYQFRHILHPGGGNVQISDHNLYKIFELEEGFVNTTAGKSSPSDVDKFKKFLSDPFIEGDEIVLNYHKGEAVHLYKNNKERGTFDGLEFKQALFGIWLGGNPADDSLKEEMLGL